MPSKQPSRLRRILVRTLIALAGLVVLVLVLVSLTAAFLPTIVSTDRFHRLITEQLERSLNQPVHIRKIDWTWTRGLTISGLNIAGLPDFSDKPLISLSRAHLVIRLPDLLKRRLNFTFLLENPEIHLVRDESGRLNLTEAFAGAEAEAKAPEPEPEAPKSAFALPLDIKTDIHLADIYVSFQDLQTNQRYTLKNGDVRLKAPSIIERPLQASIDADMAVNGQDIPHCAINADIKNLFGPNGKIRPARASARVEADLPGTSIDIKGDMTAKGIKGKVSIDLETLAGIAAPMLPGVLKNTDIGGRIHLKAEAAQTGKDAIEFETTLSGETLSVAGKLIGGNRLGPGDIDVRAAGAMDLNKDRLTLAPLAIQLLNNSRLELQGKIDALGDPAPLIDLTVAPVHIDLKEIADFGSAYLPPGLALARSPEDRTELSIEKLRLKGRLPTGRATAEIRNLALSASHLSYQRKSKSSTESSTDIQIQNPRLSIPSVKTTLADLMPASAELSAAVRIKEMVYAAGDTRLSVNRLALEAINGIAEDIEQEDHSPLGVSGNFGISNTASIDALTFKDRLTLAGARQELSVKLAVDPDGTANGAMERLAIRIPRIKLSDPSYGPVETSAGVHLSLSDLRVNDIEALDLDIEDLAARLDVGRMLALNIHANAEQTGKKGLNARADADIRLNEIMKTFKLKDRLKMDGEGNARLQIQVSGKRPGPEQTAGLKALKLSESLDFLDRCRIDLDLSNGAFHYQPDDPTRLTIGRISGDPLLSYRLSGKTASGRLSSRIDIKGVSNIFTLRPKQPVSARLSLDLRHKGAERIKGSQRLHVQPGGIEQTAEISLDDIGSAIAHKDPYEIFRRISGQAAAGIRIKEARGLKKFAAPGMETVNLDGSVSSAVNVRKLPENKVAAEVRLSAADLSAAMTDLFTLNGINGDIVLSKDLNIEKTDAAGTEGVMGSWLSRQVMRSNGPSPSSGPLPSSALNSRIKQMTAYSAPEHGLSLQSGEFNAGGLPIAIGPSRISLGLSRGLPGIDYFNLDILGGTFLGDLLIRPSPSGYLLETRINFTGIDPGQIFPEAAAGIEGGQSEVSGALSASIPIARQMQNVLENSEIRVDFRKIGSRALERLLYALDPYESNEAIVSQRRILRMGSPKEIHLEIKDGFLSLEGEIMVRSVPIAIPPIERLNIARLPGIEEFESSLSVIGPIIEALDMAAAEILAPEKVFGRK